jgi:NAD(P)H dehydrogenase (quinone)
MQQQKQRESKAMKKKFLVTAATGDTGKYTSRLLLERGYQVRAVAHREDKRSQALAAAGAEVIFGDLVDLGFISEATKGIDGAYFCYPIKPGIVQATAYFAQAARENGVKSIVNMSQISALRDSASKAAQNHWIAEQVFDWSGLAVTHIRPTYFAEWLLYLAPMIAQGVMNVPFRDNRHAPIAAEDQARVISAILENPAPHAGKVYPLYGPVELTQAEIAAEVGRVLGHEVKYNYVDFDLFFQTLKQAQADDPAGSSKTHSADNAQEKEDSQNFLGQHLREVAINYENGVFAGTNDIVREIGGVPGTTVADFVNTHRQAFAARANTKEVVKNV